MNKLLEQNAEEVIAAERMKLEASARVGLQLSEQIEVLEADNASLIHDLNRIKDHETELINDNAAKDVRIAELEEHFSEMTRSCLAERDRNKVLEADNKRLREALEPFANVAEHDIGDDEDDGDIFWPMSNARYSMAGRLRVGDLRRASEALGEVKP